MNLFHRSEWDSGAGAVPSTAYTVYRLAMAAFMATGVTLHIVATLDTLGIKWLIYMTNQGILLLTIHYVLYAGIVTANFFLPRGLTYTGSLPFIYK